MISENTTAPRILLQSSAFSSRNTWNSFCWSKFHPDGCIWTNRKCIAVGTFLKSRIYWELRESDLTIFVEWKIRLKFIVCSSIRSTSPREIENRKAAPLYRQLTRTLYYGESIGARLTNLGMNLCQEYSDRRAIAQQLHVLRKPYCPKGACCKSVGEW